MAAVRCRCAQVGLLNFSVFAADHAENSGIQEDNSHRKILAWAQFRYITCWPAGDQRERRIVADFDPLARILLHGVCYDFLFIARPATMSIRRRMSGSAGHFAGIHRLIPLWELAIFRSGTNLLAESPDGMYGGDERRGSSDTSLAKHLDAKPRLGQRRCW